MIDKKSQQQESTVKRILMSPYIYIIANYEYIYIYIRILIDKHILSYLYLYIGI